VAERPTRDEKSEFPRKGLVDEIRKLRGDREDDECATV
jgi:hypothetical protein